MVFPHRHGRGPERLRLSLRRQPQGQRRRQQQQRAPRKIQILGGGGVSCITCPPWTGRTPQGFGSAAAGLMHAVRFLELRWIPRPAEKSVPEIRMGRKEETVPQDCLPTSSDPHNPLSVHSSLPLRFMLKFMHFQPRFMKCSTNNRKPILPKIGVSNHPINLSLQQISETGFERAGKLLERLRLVPESCRERGEDHRPRHRHAVRWAVKPGTLSGKLRQTRRTCRPATTC